MSHPLLIAVKFVNKLPLEEITSEDRVGLRIVNCRHLEQEHLVWSLHCLGQLICIDVEKVGVSQEFTREPTKDHNVLSVSLDHAAPLSLREQFLVDVN